MTILNAGTRRDRTFAAPPADWKVRSACRGADPDDFFSTSHAGKGRARSLCAACPVIAECLTWQRAKDEDIYRWGIGGGLDANQRRALELEEVLGNRPNLRMAQLLISPRWSYRLQRLRSSCRSLEGMTAALRKDGLMVDEVTVRVAVWWSGGDGSRIARQAPGDKRNWRAQLRDDYTDVVVALHRMGARNVDVAAYLGIPGTNGAKAVSGALKAAEACGVEVAA